MCLLWNLLVSFEDKDDLSVVLDRSRKHSQKVLTNNETVLRKFLVRILSEEAFSFTEDQESCTYCLAYTVPRERNNDKAVINRSRGTINPSVVIRSNRRKISNYKTKKKFYQNKFNASTRIASLCSALCFHAEGECTKSLDFWWRSRKWNWCSFLVHRVTSTRKTFIWWNTKQW